MQSMSKNQSQHIVELSALLVDLEGGAPSEIKLVPCGSFRSARDNRPVGLSAWVMNDDCATAILSAQAQLKSKFLVDYDHQTLHAATSGAKALAAGWGGSLEWREGDGLYAVDMDWNEAALSAIAAKEYRYISPVIKFDSKTGRVTGVPMAALTNYPALDNLNDLAAAAALLFSTPQETTMDKELLALLCAVLGMPGTATTAELSGELDKIKTQLTAEDGSTTGLSALLSTKTDEIAALSAQIGAEPDPTQYAPVAVVAELRSQLAALSAGAIDDRVEKLIEQGLADGRIIGEPTKAWLTDMGKKDIAALQGYLDSAQPIAALSGTQTGGKAPADSETEKAALSGFKVPDGGYSVDPGTAAKHNKILAYAQANKVDYPTAAKAVGA
jgi:phage I-like protein